MRINQKIKGKENFKSIGILDIFGFENFEVKTMCIQWPYEDNGEVTQVPEYHILSLYLAGEPV